MVSKYFPAYHPKVGKETEFIEKIWQACVNVGVGYTTPEGLNNFPILSPNGYDPKIHTIRSNYDL